MTSNNVGALLVVKSGEKKALAGIITERGKTNFFSILLYTAMSAVEIVFNVICRRNTYELEDGGMRTDYLRKIIVQGKIFKDN